MTNLLTSLVAKPASIAQVLNKPATPPPSPKQLRKRIRRSKKKKPVEQTARQPKKPLRVDWAYKHFCTWGSKTSYRRLLEDKPDKQKLRGARKKRLLQLEKEMYPKGRPMCKPAEPPKHRSIVYIQDVMALTHYDKRAARRYLTRIRKLLGKPRGELITLKEFCSKTPFTKEEVIPYLV